MHRRVGKFRVSRGATLMQGDGLKTLRLIQDKVLVIRCEMMLHTGCLEYVALSEEFDELKPYEEAPWYNVWVHRDGNVDRVEFVRELKKGA